MSSPAAFVLGVHHQTVSPTASLFAGPSGRPRQCCQHYHLAGRVAPLSSPPTAG